MKKLLQLVEKTGINLIDIGSSGSLDLKWKPLEKIINLVGFDPNKNECDRMNNKKNNYLSSKFLPYAIGGFNGEATLYKTKSIFCYSLLKPNEEWLNRFSFYDKFTVEGNEKVDVVTLDSINELRGINFDVLKCDTQGLELPILKQAKEIVKEIFYLETETGFTRNYVDETTFTQISEFAFDNGFLMFDLNINHRIARNNVFKNARTGKEQILWAEAVWLKDYVSLLKKNIIKEESVTREKAIKILILCANQGCIDFGYELAALFHEMNLLNEAEFASLRSANNWDIPNRAKLLHTTNHYYNKAKNKIKRELKLK